MPLRRLQNGYNLLSRKCIADAAVREANKAVRNDTPFADFTRVFFFGGMVARESFSGWSHDGR
jgi:hypothetical protein